jgi:hypothetical protein
MIFFGSRFTRLIERTALAGAVSLLWSASLFAADTYEYRVLATNKTSTMEKEMNQAADAGYEFSSTMGGDTAFGGKEVVVVMMKAASATGKKQYKLLATNKTSTMQKEISEMGAEGFEYKGQTVFQSALGGREVAVILELDSAKKKQRIEFKLLATSRTSTMEKELAGAGKEGFALTGLTVGKTALGGNEVVSILRRVGK